MNITSDSFTFSNETSLNITNNYYTSEDTTNNDYIEYLLGVSFAGMAIGVIIGVIIGVTCKYLHSSSSGYTTIQDFIDV